MSEVKFAEDGARDALNDLRSDASPTNWVVLGYDAKNVLELQGSGSGGLEELHGKLDPTQIQYAMVRVSDVVDGHETVKFVWIVWQGSKVKMIKKARVTTHRGDVKDFFGQAHVTLDANTVEEVSEAEVMGRVTDASGTSVRVLEGQTAGERVASDRTVVAGGHGGAGPLTVDKAAIAAAAQAVRGGADGAWMMMGYERVDSNIVKVLHESHEGGGDDMSSYLSANTPSVAYGLVHVQTAVDDNPVQRFVLVSFTNASLSGMRKAQTVTHRGTLIEAMGQYHTDINIEDAAEVSSSILVAAVEKAAGVAINERQVANAPSSNTASSNAPPSSSSSGRKEFSASLVSNPKKGNAVNTASVSVAWASADAQQSAEGAIAAVRSDGDATDWMLLANNDALKVELVGQGQGGSKALADAITDEEKGSYYGLLRINTTFDDHDVVKFVFIIFLGDNIKVVRKAKLATKIGGIIDAIGQFHLKLEVASREELAPDVVAKAVDTLSFENK